MWQKFFGGPENEELRSVIKTNDNYLASVGYTESKGDPDGDIYFLKINLNGDTLFTKTIGGLYKDQAYDIVQKSNGEYIIGGAKTYSLNAGTESYMYSMDAAGAFNWDKPYSRGPESEYFASITNSKHKSNYTGYVRSVVTIPSLGKQDELLVADYGGYVPYINASGGSRDEWVYSLEATEDKGYVSVGSTESFGSIGKDVYFIKQDSLLSIYPSMVSLSKLMPETALSLFYNEDHIYLKSSKSEQPTTIDIFDVNMKLIKAFTGDFTNALDVSDLPPSIYIVRAIRNGVYLETLKFIKQD